MSNHLYHKKMQPVKTFKKCRKSLEYFQMFAERARGTIFRR